MRKIRQYFVPRIFFAIFIANPITMKWITSPTTAASIKLPKIVQDKKNPARDGILIIRAIMLPFVNNSFFEVLFNRSSLSNCWLDTWEIIKIWHHRNSKILYIWFIDFNIRSIWQVTKNDIQMINHLILSYRWLCCYSLAWFT